jgi:agmatine/peptidylarginine deiminase
MMKNKFYILTFSLLIGLNSFAQQKRNGHLPAAKTKAEYQLMLDNAKKEPVFLGKGATLPSNMRMPGEFEESKAVCISWAYDYDEFYNILGVDTYTTYGWISAQLAHYISEECEVWIRTWEQNDSIKILTFMESLGWPLKNYKFFPKQGDDFWIRDYGPMSFYYGTKDSVGFTDMKYYAGRDLDNVFPAYLANKMGYNNYVSALNAEGGNLMTDGYGKMFFSSIIRTENQAINKWTATTTFNTMKSIFGTPSLHELPTLTCDGGTGHIDLFTRFIDEETLMVSKLPAEVTASDKQKIEDSYQIMTGLTSTYNRPYTIYRIPHPTGDDGKHDSVTCDQLNNDARNFINGISVNNSFLFPSYSDEFDGNQKQTDSIVELYKSIMPGYKIIPIDSRDMSPLGGAIHCITMQIPADNPIRIWHPKIQVNKVFQNNFKIIAKCENYSGIKTAKCIYRKNNDAWQTLNLTDSAGYHIGILTVSGLTTNDFVEYYIAAESNNGKKVTKPTTANADAQGYYRIQFENGTNLNEVLVTPKNYLFAAYPNPANAQLHIPFQLLEKGNISIKITDITGKILVEQSTNAIAGQQENIFNISGFSNGLYFYTLSLNGEIINTRKFLKQ